MAQPVLLTTESGTFFVLGVQREIDPVPVTIGNLGDFLLFLFDDRNLAASTIHTFNAAILSVLSPRQIFTPAQLELGTLNKLCSSFKRRRPPKRFPVPTWDIGLVLRAFSQAPLEPLDSTSLQAVSYKTFVLVALALGTHRGKLRALHRGHFVHPAEDWSFVLLYSDPLFTPKTAKGRLPTEPYKLRALPSMA